MKKGSPKLIDVSRLCVAGVSEKCSDKSKRFGLEKRVVVVHLGFSKINKVAKNNLVSQELCTDMFNTLYCSNS